MSNNCVRFARGLLIRRTTCFFDFWEVGFIVIYWNSPHCPCPATASAHTELIACFYYLHSQHSFCRSQFRPCLVNYTIQLPIQFLYCEQLFIQFSSELSSHQKTILVRQRHPTPRPRPLRFCRFHLYYVESFFKHLWVTWQFYSLFPYSDCYFQKNSTFVLSFWKRGQASLSTSTYAYPQ